MLILDHTYSTQETGYNCGPASSQIVLTARGIDVAESQLAYELEALEGNVGWNDQDGTDSIVQVTTVLGRRTGQPYVTRQIPNDPPTGAQVDLLRSDVKRSIDGGNGVVANIVAPASNHPPGYPNYTVYHYIAIVGYDDVQGVYVADPANFGGIHNYWLSWEKIASLIAPKGYSAAPVERPAAPANEDDDDAAWLPILTQFVGPVA
ncbi:C39 family peptidase [Rhodococcus sp. WB9]|uniref:C39 family peptidase n=1 Tax=Rhodococcus sp. WB9 TaxID=2594007 RepID=UPI001642E24A|nr:C39 family peptidase [Rhodococcus sp. WB9]